MNMQGEITDIDHEHLMIRYISGEATVDEQNQLLEWLKQSPDNVKELSRLRTISKISSSASNSISFDYDQAFSKFENTVATPKSTKSRSLIYWSASIAAMLVLVFCIRMFTTKQAETIILLGNATNSKQELALVDGSYITLNTQSSLKAIKTFDKQTRSVILKGEAYFDVKHDESHPFTISVDSVTIKVLGTAFNVYSDSITHNVTVTVKRGRVAVMYKEQSLIISAGEQASFIGEQKKIGLTKKNIVNYESWKTGQLVFNDTPLNEVIEALNKQYATDFEIASPELKDCKLNASFDNSDIKKVTELLSIVLKVDIKSENGKQLLYCRSFNKK